MACDLALIGGYRYLVNLYRSAVAIAMFGTRVFPVFWPSLSPRVTDLSDDENERKIMMRYNLFFFLRAAAQIETLTISRLKR